MTMDQALDLGREAFLLSLIISAPILVIGLVVGLVISVLQAVTQLHEQTLSFVPKIVAMAAATLFFLPWITIRMLEYTRELLSAPQW